jgi:hypothetical protein
LEQIPTIAVTILEDGDGPIRLRTWSFEKRYAAGAKRGIIAVKIIGVQK